LDGAPETRVLFNNISDATAFRFACYKFRRRTNIGLDLSFVIEGEVMTDDGPKISVFITKTPTPASIDPVIETMRAEMNARKMTI